jgi:glycosyltransferase involved in cell wall biosynthesis
MSKRVVMLLSDPYRPDARLQKEIRSLKKLNIDLTVLAWDRENQYPLEEEVDGGRIRRIKQRGVYSKSIVFLAFGIIRFWVAAFVYIMRGKCDLVHAHNLDTLIPGFIAAKIKRIKIIYDAHETFPEKLEQRRFKIISSIAYAVEAFLSKRVDAVIAVVQPLIDKYTKWDIKKLYLVPNYAHAHFYNSPVAKIRKEHFTIGWIGSIRPNMGIEILLEVMPEILERDKNIKILLAGKIYGEEFKNKLLRLVNPIKNNVEICDWVPYQDLPLKYAQIDLAVNLLPPSKINEMRLSVKILEAFACGVPAISTRVGPIREIITEAESGFLIDYDKKQLVDAVSKMALDRELTARMGKNGREIVIKKYNWEAVGNKLVSIYEELLDLTTEEGV